MLNIKLTDREVYLLRRALAFWRDSERILPAEDPTIAPEMTKLQARIEDECDYQGVPILERS